MKSYRPVQLLLFAPYEPNIVEMYHYDKRKIRTKVANKHIWRVVLYRLFVKSTRIRHVYEF